MDFRRRLRIDLGQIDCICVNQQYNTDLSHEAHVENVFQIMKLETQNQRGLSKTLHQAHQTRFHCPLFLGPSMPQTQFPACPPAQPLLFAMKHLLLLFFT